MPNNHKLRRFRKVAARKQRHRCHYCDAPMWTKNAWAYAEQHGLRLEDCVHFQCTAAHVIARRDGGVEVRNIVAACRHCNLTRHETENPLKLSWLSDGMNDSLNAEIGEVLRKTQRINKDPGPFFRQVFSLAPQTLFLILPVFALLLKLVYIFKRRFYTEHLIVALHSHSFLCLSIILIILLAKTKIWAAEVAVVPGIAQFLLVLVGIWIGLYLLLMQKRVYQQGWFMTVLKFGFVGFCYPFLLGFGMVGTMLASIILL